MATDNRPINPPSFPVVAGIIIGLAILVLASASIVVVEAGERAVIFDKVNGVLEETRGEGVTFIVPFLQTAIPYNVKTQTINMIGNKDGGAGLAAPSQSIAGLTKDGQTVALDLSVRFHPDPVKVWKLHQEVGPGYASVIIVPEIRSVVRTVVSEFNVLDVYSEKRREMQEIIQAELQKTYVKYDIILKELLIRNVVFSEEFQKAIEAKQVALQDAQRMQYVLDKERQEKERRVIEAQGRAEAISLVGKALASNPRLIQYEYVQKLSPGVKAVITDQNTIMNMSGFLKEK